MSIVFDAEVVEGDPAPDGDETIAVGWFSSRELGELELTDFTVALLSDPAVAILDAG